MIQDNLISKSLIILAKTFSPLGHMHRDCGLESEHVFLREPQFSSFAGVTTDAEDLGTV